MKKIIEHANRSGCSHILPSGYNLKRECETRFETYYQVTERFLKSAPKISLHVKNLYGSAVQEAYISLKNTSNVDGTIIGCPGFEAIFNGFSIVFDCIVRFETSQRPTLQIALARLYKMFRELDGVSKGGDVWRGAGVPSAKPSIYSRGAVSSSLSAVIF